MSNLKYGLIGHGIGYSLSPIMHNYLFEKYKVDASYEPIDTDRITTELLASYAGGNITIPYKYDAYKLAGDANQIISRDRSVNCFKNDCGNLVYDSSDQAGISDSIYKLGIFNIRRKLHIIFGDGATAEMIASSLINDFSVPARNVKLISRKQTRKADPQIISYQAFKEANFKLYALYNATPLGVGTKADISPFDDDDVSHALGVFDTSYRPRYNCLAKQCYKHRVRYVGGLNMLVLQGLKAFEFWTGIDCLGDYCAVKREMLFASTSKLVICAMPFAGKTTLSRNYRAGSVDLDQEISDYLGCEVADYIKVNGIDKFRAVEAEVLARVLADDEVKVVFLGGGTLTNEASIECLSNELIIYMTVRLETLIERFNHSRANIQSVEQLKRLYKERDGHYQNIASFSISSRNIERIINEYLDN